MMGDSNPETQQSLRCSQATPSVTKRKRSSKASSNQIEAFLALLEARPFLVTRRFTGLQGKENFESAWREIADELNNHPSGSVKTPEQWMTVWRDYKSRACSKAAKLKKERLETGNKLVKTPPLTAVEERIVCLVGVDYTVGTNCPDSMPEECVLQCQLEAGGMADNIIILPEDTNVEMDDLPDVEIAAQIPQIHIGSMEPTAHQLPPVMPVSEITGALSQTLQRTPRATEPTQKRPKRNKNLNPRQSVAEQHHSARSDFLAVAESNAESTRMLAAAMKVQADATKVHADAAKVQAEASVLFAQAVNKIADALMIIANKNN